jgi:glucose/arabinose dehydrogenase
MDPRPARRLPAAAWLATVVAAAALASCSTNPPSEPPRGSTPPPSASGPAATKAPSASVATGAPTGSAARLSDLAIALEPFASVPGGPLAIAAPNDGSGRLFVAAQDGKAWVVEADGTTRPGPLVDLSDRLRSGGEQGLLGIALHPGFPTDPRVFVDYTDKAGDTIVASLTLDPGDPNRLDPASQRQLLFVDQPFANHNGGALAFGPDGYLYVSLGDGGSGGDPQGNGQNTNALLGKILRLDIDSSGGDQAYAIPSDNPFANGGGRGEVWLYGLRNPWRLSFDRANGDLWIGDVGQNAFEEVDVARAGIGGLNFGWNRMEGSHCFRSDRCERDGLTLPVSDYGRDLGCTVIGGYVYRGSRYPFLAGTYLFTDYCSGEIFALDASSNGLVAPVTVGNGSSGISAFGEDAGRELYITALDGTVSKVVATLR